MPMHDWTRVEAGTFHNFHYRWIASIMDYLNGGTLPDGYFAMAEQVTSGPSPDVVTLQGRDHYGEGESAGGTATLVEKPRTKYVVASLTERYAQKKNRISIHHRRGDIVAVIEIVSPGNKHSERAFKQFVTKVGDLVGSGINVLIVDPFPPGPRDLRGVHPAIWEGRLLETDYPLFELPDDKRLTMVSYQAEPLTAYIEPVAVGDPLPMMPLFLDGDFYVDLPLEETYAATWNLLPAQLKKPLEG